MIEARLQGNKKNFVIFCYAYLLIDISKMKFLIFLKPQLLIQHRLIN